MRLRRKAYLRTLEAFMAFFLTFSFLIYIAATRHASTPPEHPQLYVLNNFEQRPDFRDCAYTSNVTCLEDMVNSSIPAAYGFHMTVNDASYERDEDIFLDSLYITGDTASDRYVVRLYYWKKH